MKPKKRGRQAMRRETGDDKEQGRKQGSVAGPRTHKADDEIIHYTDARSRIHSTESHEKLIPLRSSYNILQKRCGNALSEAVGAERIIEEEQEDFTNRRG
jgi:hypothetical protein